MKTIQHLAKKNELWAKIKAVGNLWGEEDQCIKEYAKDRYEAFKCDLEPAIACFCDLLRQAKLIKAK